MIKVNKGGMVKKKYVFIIGILILFVTHIYAKVLPERYYEIKEKLPLETEDNTSYGGTLSDKERDLPIIDKLIEIINNYNYSEEVVKERKYLIGAIMILLPHEQKDTLYNESYMNDFENYDSEKRKYYLIMKNWFNENAIEFYIKKGVLREDAIKLLDALSVMANTKTYKEGKINCEELFKMNFLKISFFRMYFYNLNEEDKELSINTFFDLYFDKIEPKEFIDEEAELAIKNISYYIKDENKRIIFAKKIIKKYNEINNDEEIAGNVDRGVKNAIVNILTEKNIVNTLKPEVVEFFKKSKILKEDKKDAKYYLNKEALEFINKNKAEILLDEDAITKINEIPNK